MTKGLSPTITRSHRRKWWLIRKAGKPNASAIAKVFAPYNTIMHGYWIAFRQLLHEIRHDGATMANKTAYDAMARLLVKDIGQFFGEYCQNVVSKYMFYYFKNEQDDEQTEMQD